MSPQANNYLCMGPGVQDLPALLALETGRVPVFTHGLAPLREVNWLTALPTRPHPGIVWKFKAFNTYIT